MKNKLLRYEHIDVANAFEKEQDLIEQIKRGKLEKGLMIWQPKNRVLVLPSGAKWPKSERLTQALFDDGWFVEQRKTGGAPVPQCPGIINCSFLYKLSKFEPFKIEESYTAFCQLIQKSLQEFNIESEIHATPGSYCDGDYNLNVNGKKVVGTAQRVIQLSGGEKLILAQACILYAGNVHDLVKPVNITNNITGVGGVIKAEVHDTLSDSIELEGGVNQYMTSLVNAFLNSKSA